MLDPRELEVDAPIESGVLVMRRNVLQLGPAAFEAARALAKRRRQLKTEFPVMPDAVGVLRHHLQRSTPVFNSRTGPARLVDVRLEGMLAGPVRELKTRSEEHTSELQSRLHLVCRLLLEKKKKNT